MKTLILAISIGAFQFVAEAAAPTATLSWTPAVTLADGTPLVGTSMFAVYGGPGSGRESLLQTGITTPNAIVTGVSGQSWCYQVTQIFNGAESEKSVEVCKTFPASAPSAPTGVLVK